MNTSKYYDYLNHQPLDFHSEGAKFTKHANNFNIFLSPEKILSSDEYLKPDPYGIQQNRNSPFQQRRIEQTVDLVNKARAAIEGQVEILDIGCGEGHLTEEIRKSVENAEITGVDYSLSAIEYAHKYFPHIHFDVADVYEMPYAPQFFDIVVCNDLWEHVPDPLFLLQKISMILKPNGYLIISTPSRYRFENILNILRGRAIRFMSSKHVTEYSVGQIKEQLNYGNFQLITFQSKAIPSQNSTITLLMWLIKSFIKMVGSHHQLEITVFYLAQKKN